MDFVWNQRWLESRWGGPLGSSQVPCDEAPEKSADISEVRLDSPRSILRGVLEHAPKQPVVYPTEGYYYYTFRLGHRMISGNIRFAAARSGSISVGYFDREHPRRSRSAEFRDGEDGIVVEEQPRGCVRLRIEGGPERVFRVIDHAELPPPRMPLRSGEEIVASIIDESGVPFVLLWHEPSESFYYCLHDALPIGDVFDRVHGHERFLVGRDSRFVLFEDQEGRRYLIGVQQEQVRENSWYDGPFDQVPPHLAIRDKLERSYPYVRMRGGIDEHGNFCELEGQRVAISPYRDYVSVDDLIRECEAIWQEASTDHDAVLRITYEPKRRFHERLANMPPSPAALWPPNHWGWVSSLWPREHTPSTSGHWPANHFPANSRQAMDVREPSGS